MIYFLIILTILLFDQALKYIVTANMHVFESIPIIDGVLNITYIQNTGAAFSILQGKSELLLTVNIVLMIIMLVFLIYGRNKEKPLVLTGVAFIIGGGFGNIIDRLIRGFVVDYVQVSSFPVFNLADVFVCTGCGLVVLYILFFERKKRKNAKAVQADSE